MNYKKLAEAALERRQALVDEAKAASTNPRLTATERQARVAELNTEIEAKTDEARSLIEQGEREAETRALASGAGSLVVPSTRGWGSAKTEIRANQPLPVGAGFADLTNGAASTRDFGEYVRALVFGGDVRALNEGTESQGGFLVPQKYAAGVLDLARNKSRVVEAGATVVPMDSKKVQVAKLTGDADPSWRDENAAIASDDLTLDAVTFEARSLAVLVKASWEIMEDAANVGEVLQNALAEAFALKLDHAALYGTGVAPEPKGLKNVTGVEVAYMGADGAPLTSYDPIVSGVEFVRSKNYDPRGIILAERSERQLGTIKDTTNAYIAPPSYLDGVARLATGQVPTNLTRGTATNASDAFIGDWKHLGIGVRTSFEIKVMKELYAANGQIGFIGWLRADVQVSRPDAFYVLSGITA